MAKHVFMSTFTVSDKIVVHVGAGEPFLFGMSSPFYCCDDQSFQYQVKEKKEKVVLLLTVMLLMMYFFTILWK